MKKEQWPTKQYSFPAGFFRWEWRGHSVAALTDRVYEDMEGQLAVHINLICSRCKKESTVRWRVGRSDNSYGKIAARSKLLALAPYRHECGTDFESTSIP